MFHWTVKSSFRANPEQFPFNSFPVKFIFSPVSRHGAVSVQLWCSFSAVMVQFQSSSPTISIGTGQETGATSAMLRGSTAFSTGPGSFRSITIRVDENQSSNRATGSYSTAPREQLSDRFTTHLKKRPRLHPAINFKAGGVEGGGERGGAKGGLKTHRHRIPL